MNDICAPRPVASRYDAIAAELHDHGYAIQPGFVEAELARVLAFQARERHADGQFRRAGIGRGEDWALRPDIRGDEVLWLDETRATPQQRRFLDALGELRLAINRRLFLGLFDYEGHFAAYPPGAHYQRHLDRFQDGGRRTMTAILYLNEGWTAADGGQLRIHRPAGGTVDVLPVAGTLVTFISAEIEHEVLPARRERLSVTGWFRRRSPATATEVGSVTLS